MMYPLVRDLAAGGVPVAVTCRVLGFTKQSFYEWLSDPVSQRDFDDAHLINAAIDIHADDPGFGYRFISDEITHVAGLAASERRVWRLCSQQRIWSSHAKKPGRRPRPGPPVHDDHVQRVFTADGPNQTWLTDLTEHPTAEGKVYLCAVKDVFSNRIVGYSMADHMGSSVAVKALAHAVAFRNPHATVVHSDRGSQFRSRAYMTELARHNLTGSMGRVGSCADNAAMESFFALLQKNVLDRQSWTTREELRGAITYWIEASYHRRRRQRALGKLTPVEYEMIHQSTPVTLE